VPLALGDRLLGTELLANGGMKDVGGQLVFLNRNRRVAWGAALARIPYVYGYQSLGQDASGGLVVQNVLYHTYVSEASGLAAYPLSSTRRVEGELGFTRYAYDLSQGTGIRDALLRAGSGDTVRTRVYTGKPARLLKTKWTEAWEAEDAPAPLPMPLQNLLVADAHNRMNSGDDPDTISMPAGQIVGRTNEIRPVEKIMAELVAEYEETVARLEKIRG